MALLVLVCCWVPLQCTFILFFDNDAIHNASIRTLGQAWIPIGTKPTAELCLAMHVSSCIINQRNFASFVDHCHEGGSHQVMTDFCMSMHVSLNLHAFVPGQGATAMNGSPELSGSFLLPVLAGSATPHKSHYLPW